MATYKKSTLFLAALLFIWIVITTLEWVRPVILPSPWAVIKAFFSLLFKQSLLWDIGVTLLRVLTAITIAFVIGVPVGLFLGYRQDYYKIVEMPLHALRSVPATALFPLFLIIIGVGEGAIISLATYPCLLIMLVNTVSGVQLANARRVHQAKIFQLNIYELVTEVLFWEALPSIFNGIRVSVSYCLVLVIAVEMFIGVGDTGLGRKIYDYQATYQIPEAYTAIIIAALIGIVLNWLVSSTEKIMLSWYPNINKQHD